MPLSRQLLCLLVACVAAGVSVQATDPTPADVFEKRIRPIFQSPNPSSCVQCHLAGVDLKNYILPDADKTFRSLRDQGLIDLDKPAASKIVKLIDMGGGATGPDIHVANRKAERDAFLAWITACAADPAMRASPPLAEGERAKPGRPVEVIRHARSDRLLDSFDRNVWAWRFRCMSCHTEGTPQNDKHRKKYGDRVAWVKKSGAAATMEYLIASQLIDATRPDRSPLLRKPLGDKHEGGVKFAVGDDAYKGFRTWIEDVAAIRGDKYAKVADLPPADTGTARFGTDTWFKITDCPPAWGDKLLQARVFAWDAGRKRWEDSPIAVSDRPVAGKPRLWQHNLTLLADKTSDRAKAWRTGEPSLPAGRYLAKVYIDRGGKLAADWKAVLGEKDAVGQIEFWADWRPGYGTMTTTSANNLKQSDRK